MMDWTPFTILMSVGIATSTGLWALFKNFSVKLKENGALVYSQTEKIINKLEYHERHDDQRFAALTNDVWSVKLQLAGQTIAQKETNTPL